MACYGNNKIRSDYMLKKLSLFCVILLASCTQKCEEKPSSLFVIVAKYGEVRQASKGDYELVLKHEDIEKALAFTDRPQRLVQPISREKFMTLWSAAPQSFEKDPPNAALVMDQHLEMVVLLSVRVEGQNTIFTIRPDGDKPLEKMSGSTQLFVDAMQIISLAPRLPV